MKTFLSLLFWVILLSTHNFGQSTSTVGTSNPQSNAPTFQSEKYRVSIETVQRKANNYMVTLIFENISDKTIKVLWLKRGRLPKSDGPHLVDEKGNKYFIETDDQGGVLSDVWSGGESILPHTKFKIKYTFFGVGEGRVFSLMASEIKDVNYYVPVLINGIKLDPLAEKETKVDRPNFTTESYRAVVDSFTRNGESIFMTMVFESLSENTITLCWGRGYFDGDIWKSNDLYLIDENADRYYLRAQDTAKIVDNGCRVEILPRTKLKTQFIFNAGEYKGSTFTFAAKEGEPKDDRPVVIQNLKIDN